MIDFINALTKSINAKHTQESRRRAVEQQLRCQDEAAATTRTKWRREIAPKGT